MLPVFPIVLLVLAALLLWWMASTIVITPQNHVRMIETFGKYAGYRNAGLSFKAPWPFQTASHPFSLQIRQIQESIKAKSSDNAFVALPVTVQYRVAENAIKDAFYKLAAPEKQISAYVANQARSSASSRDLDELFRSRDAIEADVKSFLEVKMQEFGYRIENVLVDDPQPSDELRQAFDRVLAATRLREAAENEGEASRIKLVKNAEAEKESLKLKGEAMAEFRRIVSEGNAAAIEAFCQTTGLTAEHALHFFLDINEKEAITNAAQHSNIVFIAGSAGTQAQPALAGIMGAAAQPARQ